MSEKIEYIVQQELGKNNWIDLLPTYPQSEYLDSYNAALSHLLDAKSDNVSSTIKFRLIKRETIERVIA
ncbi:hypothetical protein A2Z67_03780 [Candidatus Woesebacteria bacterium RBG_13_36_22]|uniref:Uncharacterized protein n=1 Tax=Candidatus Woesebacteria bacterium RBG_13_36_22 TaxID=1802478 RepID=A0A1F7X275_9BACT|nr:MAG: hypothetical protein A2Z67_03780 [Candidatus Woesebacteria bacterium RBG_13_36_22]